jgi:hypothetical protein
MHIHVKGHTHRSLPKARKRCRSGEF